MKSNKKRFVLVLAVLTMAIVLSFVFVACGNNTNKTGTEKAADYKVTIHPNNGQSDIVWDITKEIPTITKDGYHIAGYYLDAEMTISTSFESLKATGLTNNIDIYVKWEKDVCKHVAVTDAAVEPTCTEKGLTEGKHCSKCGKILTAQTEIDALGHKYGDLISKTEPTCSETGTEAHYKCSACNKVFKDDEHKTETTLDDLTIAINPAAHNFGEWIKNEGADTHTRVCSFNNEHTETENCIGGTATCTEKAVCEKCKAKYGKALGHDIEHHAEQPATCTEKGWAAYEMCKRNGCTYTTYEEIGALGHIGGTATCTEQAICERCNQKYGKALGHDYQNGVCTRCGGELASEGLAYSLNSDGNGYTVRGIGTCKDNDIYIPSVYNSKPVEMIDSYAFKNCTGLTSVTIPNSVIYIGYDTFRGCTGLTTVNWNATACKRAGAIDYPIFQECSNLATVNIGANVKIIPSYVFCYCAGLTNVTIPNSVTSIGENAFFGCTGLTSITIPDSVTSIGKYAFRNCSGLTSITIPNSVTSIDENAFDGCSSLTNIEIPDSVTSIGESAFHGCTGLTSITIPDSVTSIGNYAFQGCTGLTSVKIPDSVTSIGYRAFNGCTGLTSVIIGSGVTSIGDYAFYGCSGLTSVTIDNSVTSIGYRAFYECNLTKITGPAAIVSSISQLCNSKAVEEVVITNGMIFESNSFSACTGLTSITIGSGVTSIGDSAFIGCSGLTSITVADGNTTYHSKDNCLIKTESKTLILGCKTSVIPTDGSVTSIGNYAFYGCSGLTSVTIGSGVMSIGNSAFIGCNGLTSITVADGNTKYHSKDNCLIETESKTLILGCKTSVIPTDGSVTSIGNYAFQGCTGLTSVKIGNGVTSIGNFAFNGCTGLTNITIPNSVTSIGYRAFEGCTSLTIITIPDGVTSIEESAFNGCTGLTNVTIGSGVTSIVNYAFYGCTGLTSIKFNGTIAQWNAISKGSYWKYNVPNACNVVCTDGTIPISNA